MAKLVFSAGLVALVAMVLMLAQQLTIAALAMSSIGPLPTKDLLVEVNRVGDRTEQTADNQQGQIVKQTVVPEGIRQTVTRNGVVITDDIVRRPTQSPDL